MPRLSFLTLLFLLLVSAAPSFAQDWDPGFDVPGVSSAVGGIFPLGNKVLLRQSRSIVAYDLDTESWTEAGDFANIEGVDDVEQLPDGTVIVGGSFTEIAGQSIQYIAVLEEGGWQQMGSPVNGRVRDIVVAGDRIFIGGDFNMSGSTEVNHVAEWSGDDWSPLGEGLSRDGFTGGEGILRGGLQFVDGILYAGGNFDMAGNTEVSAVAAWDGTAWSDVGGGLPNSIVFDIAEWAGNVIVGGNINGAGTTSIENLAVWNGSAWSAVGDGLPAQAGSVQRITALDSDVLYVIAAGSTAQRGVWQYDGSGWDMLPPIHQNRLPTSIRIVGGNRVWVGMGFIIFPEDPTPDQYLFEWIDDGEGWATIDQNARGLDGPVFTAIEAPDGSVVVGGNFAFAGPTPARSVARWDGSDWTAFGSGLRGDVNALAYDDQGTLYAGGQFFFAGSEQVNHIARWNGSSWESLSAGVNAVVLDLFPVDDEVWVVGKFNAAGGVESRFHAKWSILTESWIPSDLDFDEPVASINRDSDGSLLLSGWFDSAGGVDGLGRMLRLRDGVVEPIGDGSSSLFVRTLFRHAETLYAAGLFDGQPVGRLDGDTWVPHSMGLSQGGGVRDFCITPNNRLFAVGTFTAEPYNASQFEDTFAAVLKDGSWSASSSGRLTGLGTYACMTRGDDLLVFGDFVEAQASSERGGAAVPSFNMAQLLDATALPAESDFSLPSEPALFIYPNPVSGMLNVGVPREGHAGIHSVQIYDLTGRLVYSDERQRPGIGSFQLNAAQVLQSSGIYMLVMDLDGNRVRQKFVYMRE